MVQWIAGILMGGLLLCCTWMDIKKKQVSVMVLILFAFAGLGVSFVFMQNDLASLAGGVGIGVIMLAVSKLTKGGIGMGDGGLLCVTGIYLGFYKNMILFFTALLLAAMWSVFLIIVKKAGRKTELPFVPFLTAAYVGMLLV